MKHFQKCGEILIDVKSKNKTKKIYILHCTFCNVEFHQLKKFSVHIEDHLNYSEGILKETEVEVKIEPEESQVEIKVEPEEIQTDAFTAIDICNIKVEPDPGEIYYEPFAAIDTPHIKVEPNTEEFHSEAFTTIEVPHIKVEPNTEELNYEPFTTIERSDVKVEAPLDETTTRKPDLKPFVDKTNLYPHLANAASYCKVESETTGKHEDDIIICKEEYMEPVISLSDTEEQAAEGAYFSRISPDNFMFDSESDEKAEDFVYEFHIPEFYIKNERCAKRKNKSGHIKTKRIITQAERQKQYRERLKLDKTRYDAYKIREKERKRAYRKKFKQRIKFKQGISKLKGSETNHEHRLENLEH